MPKLFTATIMDQYRENSDISVDLSKISQIRRDGITVEWILGTDLIQSYDGCDEETAIAVYRSMFRAWEGYLASK